MRYSGLATVLAGGCLAFGVAAEEQQLDPVVVTTQKVRQDILDVPLSVSVIGETQIERSGLQTIDDIGARLANTNISVQHGGSMYVYVRGIGTADSLGFEQSVGLFLDGAYLGRAELLNGAFLDVERVELVRGPQGGLLGKNAVAGALDIFTVQPGEELRLDGSATFGSGNLRVFRGGADLPITDDWAARVSFLDDTRRGYIHNSTLDEDAESRRQSHFRGTFAWQPAGAWSGSLALEGGRLHVDGDGYQLSAATSEMLDYYRQYDATTEADVTDYHTATDFALQKSARESRIARARLRYDAGDFDVTWLPLLADSDYGFFLDGDFGPAPLIDLGIVEGYRYHGHELRVAGRWRAGSYLLGGQLLRHDLGLDVDTRLMPEGTAGLAAGPPPAALAPLVAGGSERAHLTFRQRTGAGSLFAQGIWDFAARWEAVAGLRWNVERKRVHAVNRFDPSGVTFMTLTGMEAYDARRERTERDLAPQASLRYDATEHLALYATHARGFKSGGFNETAPRADELEFEEERSAGWEAGAKSRWPELNLAVNLATFRTRYRDLQVITFDGLSFVADNAAQATLAGAELDVHWLAGALRVDASLGYLRARYDSFPNAPARANPGAPPGSGPSTQDLSGHGVHRAPRWSGAAGVDYVLPDLGAMRSAAGFDVMYRGLAHLNLDQDPLDDQPAHTLLDAHLRLSDAADRLRLSLLGRNLTDRVVRMESNDVPIFAGSHFARVEPPRRVELQLGFSW